MYIENMLYEIVFLTDFKKKKGLYIILLEMQNILII